MAQGLGYQRGANGLFSPILKQLAETEPADVAADGQSPEETAPMDAGAMLKEGEFSIENVQKLAEEYAKSHPDYAPIAKGYADEIAKLQAQIESLQKGGSLSDETKKEKVDNVKNDTKADWKFVPGTGENKGKLEADLSQGTPRPSDAGIKNIVSDDAAKHVAASSTPGVMDAQVPATKVKGENG